MNMQIPFGEMIPYTITRYKENRMFEENTVVAAEIPLTFVVNDHEIATLMCTPSHLKAYAYGFLFTSGLIKGVEDILAYECDEKKWRVDILIKNFVDPQLLGQRVYTAGCGKGVIYTSMVELSSRHPIDSQIRINGEDIITAMHWLQGCSSLHKQTGGVHSAAISKNGTLPQFHIDDIGRHNAVDKIIGTLLLDRTINKNLVLLTTGRISSEILHKARRFSIPVLASRGAPTHQSVLLAKEMGITIAGFIRRTNFVVFSHPERIINP
ncbi:MAG: formate dehydrogenase accessory sulfurtransferase FdhD [Desulfobacteraceae bacterium]|nr:formate dehydrogenase accessory sulfurtransferase FdhD [Desulfobacteraceae bacterium]